MSRDQIEFASLQDFRQDFDPSVFDPEHPPAFMKSCALGAKQVGDDSDRTIQIAYSAQSVDREGDIIKQSGIDLKNYRKNPVVLYAHGGGRFGGAIELELPIARAKKLFKSADKSKSIAIDEFVPAETPVVGRLAEATFQMLKGGFLNAASIGFRPIKVKRPDDEDERNSEFFFPLDFDKVEKLEHSIVPVPANPDALEGAKSVGIDVTPIKTWAEMVLDNGATLILPRESVEEAYKKANGNATTFYQAIVPKDEEPKKPVSLAKIWEAKTQTADDDIGDWEDLEMDEKVKAIVEAVVAKVKEEGASSTPEPKAKSTDELLGTLIEKFDGLQKSMDTFNGLVKSAIEEPEPQDTKSKSNGEDITIVDDQGKEVSDEALDKFLAERGQKAVEAALEEARGQLPAN